MSTKSESPVLKFHTAQLNELVLALKENRLIIVVGSGLSIPDPCGLPSWETLVLQLMPQWLENWGDPETATEIRGLKRHLLQAADIWWEKVGAEQRKDFFKKIFDADGIKIHENHQLLAQLPVRGLLTTNFDDLLEKADSRLYAIRKTGFDNDLGLLFQNTEKVFLKLHGTWNQIDSIILTKSHYARLELNQAYRKLYDAIQINYRLLFLGYGGRDPDLELMHRQLSQTFNGQLPYRFLLLNNPTPELIANLSPDKNCEIAVFNGKKEGYDIVTRLLRYLGETSNFVKRPAQTFRSTDAEVKKYWQQLVTDREFNSMPVIGQKDRRSLDSLYIKLWLTASGDKSRIDEKCLATKDTLARESEFLKQKLSPDKALQLFPRQAVLGPPGVGKTTLLHWIAYTLSKCGLGLGRAESFQWPTEFSLVPFYLPLTFLKDRKGDLLHCLQEYLNERFPNCCSWEMVQQTFQQGYAILLLDGLDEIAAAYLADIKRKIVGFLNNTDWARNRVVITCREASWQREEALLIINAVLRVAEMDADAIGEYLLHWFGAERSQSALTLKNQICHNPRLLELATNPFLLSLIAWLSTLEKLPERRADLYDKCIDALLNEKHKPPEQRSQSQFGPDHPQMKMQVLKQVAFQMMQQNLRTIGRDDLRRLVGQSLQIGNPLVDERPGRLIDEIHQGSALLREASIERIYEFQHNTFREFLAAGYLNQTSDGLQQILDKYCEDAVWTEVICLYAALQKDATLLVNTLGKKKKINLVLRLIPDTAGLDWKKLDNDVLNWKIRRSAVEQLVQNKLDHKQKEEVTGILKGVLGDPNQSTEKRKQDPNANVRYSALIALEKVGTPEAKRIVGATHIIPEAVLNEHKPYSYKARGKEFQINQPGMPPNMVLVPGGSYTMGENKKKVIVKPFYMSIFPVTNWEFRQFIKAGGYKEKKYWTKEGWEQKNEEKIKVQFSSADIRFTHDWSPIVEIDWYEASAYCQWLTEAQKAKKPFRLPKEEEWEWAASGPKGNECAFGDWNENIPRWDSYREYEKGLTYGTSRINSVYHENISDFGLFDLTGNVWEWTDSWYTEDKYRVVRGGSWDFNNHDNLRAAYRNLHYPRYGYISVGFRYCQDSP